MKKITLAFFGFLLTAFTFAQTYSTGMMDLWAGSEEDEGLTYSARVDVTSSLVTLTLVGPDARYLGFGFGVQSMSSGGDVVVFYDNPETPEEDFELSDRTFIGIGQPPSLDANQDWTLVSNTLDSGHRTVIATRVLDTEQDGDYVFSNSDSSLNFVWAIGPSYSFSGIGDAYHFDNRGASMQSIVLSNDEYALNDFKILQNPSNSKLVLSLPRLANNMKLEVFDVLGKKILSKQLNGLTSSVDVSKWNSGVYLVRVSSEKASQTKRFIKQ